MDVSCALGLALFPVEPNNAEDLFGYLLQTSCRRWNNPLLTEHHERCETAQHKTDQILFAVQAGNVELAVKVLNRAIGWEV